MLSKMNDLMGGYTVIVTTKQVQRRRHKKEAEENRTFDHWDSRGGSACAGGAMRDWGNSGSCCYPQYIRAADDSRGIAGI